MRPAFDHWVGKILWRRESYPFQYSGVENFRFHTLHSPWDCKESDVTEQLSLSQKDKRSTEERSQNIYRWRKISCSWIGLIDRVKMNIPAKTINRFNTIPLKLPTVFFIN